MAISMAPLGARFSSAVQQIRPAFPGNKNPNIGKFFIVGSIPAACYDQARNGGRGGSVIYDSEVEAIDALVLAGAPVIQGADCRKIDAKAWAAERGLQVPA